MTKNLFPLTGRVNIYNSTLGRELSYYGGFNNAAEFLTWIQDFEPSQISSLSLYYPTDND